jgi:hypothetical protein
MLNADMSRRELEELVPPIARHSEEEKDKADPDRITVNVHHQSAEACPLYLNADVCRDDAHWRISMSGRQYGFDAEGLKRLGQALNELGKTKRDPNNPDSISERSLIVRADRTAPYKLVQKVLEAASVGRLYKIQVGASLPKEDANKAK